MYQYANLHVCMHGMKRGMHLLPLVLLRRQAIR